MRSFTDTLLRDLKSEADTLRLQLSLGRAEARDIIDACGHDLSSVLADLRSRIDVGSEVSEKKADAIKRKIDELRLQLTLGKMENRDAFLEKRKKIDTALTDLRDEIAELATKAGSVTVNLGGEVERWASTYRTRFDTLALNLGLCEIIAEDELKAVKKELNRRLDKLSTRLGSALSGTEKRLGKIAGEALEEMDEILQKLREKVER